MEYMDHGFDKKYSGAARIMLFTGGCLAYYGIMVLLNRYIVFEGFLGISYGDSIWLDCPEWEGAKGHCTQSFVDSDSHQQFLYDLWDIGDYYRQKS